MNKTLLPALALCLGLAAACPPQARADSYPNPYPRAGADKVTENERVVVWNATWQEGVPTPLHEHRLDQVSVTVEGGSVRVTTPDGRDSSGEAVPGTVRFLRAGTVHREEGIGIQVRRAYMVELKRPAHEKAVAAAPRLPRPAMATAGTFAPGTATQVLDNDRVQAWDVSFARGMRWNTPLDCCDTLRVAITEDGDMSARETAFLYVPKGEAAPALETSAGVARAVFIFLK